MLNNLKNYVDILVTDGLTDYSIIYNLEEMKPEDYPSRLQFIRFRDSQIGWALIDSDTVLGANCKEAEVVTYPEDNGKRVFVNQKKEAFDYKLEFAYIDDADKNDIPMPPFEKGKKIPYNLMVSSLQMWFQGRKVIVINKYKGVTIVGHLLKTPKLDDTKLKRTDKYDYLEIELTIEVEDPTECNFQKAVVIPEALIK